MTWWYYYSKVCFYFELWYNKNALYILRNKSGGKQLNEGLLGRGSAKQLGVDSRWKGKYLSFASRVCLLRSMLTFVPLFNLSLEMNSPYYIWSLTTRRLSLIRIRSWQHNNWRWKLEWMRNLFELEDIEANQLIQLLIDLSLGMQGEDEWRWKERERYYYRVKIEYNTLLYTISGEDKSILKCFGSKGVSLNTNTCLDYCYLIFF